MPYPFGPFEPDKSGLDGSVSRIALNAYPSPEGYKPMPGMLVFGDAVLPGCKGLAYAQTTSGEWQIWGATATALWKYVSGAWVDVSRVSGVPYACPDDELWTFARFGTGLIATNSMDPPQYIDVDSGTNFDALAGSPPNARGVRAVGDFLWLYGLSTEPRKVHWSDLNDPTDWAAGGLSDFQEFPEGGPVMAVHGDKSGFVLQERAVKAFAFLPGSSYVYEFDEVEGARGCNAPYASTSVGSFVFYKGEDGFTMIGPGAPPKPIGATRVDEWWTANTDPTRQHLTLSVADPVAPRVMWAGFSGSGSATYDVLLIYDWQIDRWSHSNSEALFWAAIATPGVTLEELDAMSASLESLGASLDSRAFAGSKPTFGGISSSGHLIFAAGPNQEAVLETPEVHVSGNPAMRAFVSSVYPVADVSTGAAYLTDEDGNTLTTSDGQPIATGDLVSDPVLQISVRERLQVPPVTSMAGNLEETGWFSTRVSGRLFRFKLTIPAQATWTHAQGVEVTAVPDGMR